MEFAKYDCISDLNDLRTIMVPKVKGKCLEPNTSVNSNQKHIPQNAFHRGLTTTVLSK